ncbi:hypothetical protein V5P93_004393 [Actinokineospora auranticolor]|uniref:Uncharacterized protein n=1 Tax=Actinokineospora auranticolor TaxID=155976 RepID=A0A2S6GTG2_9PSEU|nr:hypothetical protein [Actinokineospora auranticolor]PPK68500.1 hypothetical protein CLV40_105229 [Actinokineospora auranticolor]
MKQRSAGSRVIALAVGVALIIGGITGLTDADALVVSKIGAAAAILAGLVFLKISATSSKA